jgi:hypothetical protein
MNKRILSLMFAVCIGSISAQVALPSTQTTSSNNNLGINQNSPQARLHISDDESQSNCKPAILVEGNAGSGASGGGVGHETESEGGEGTSCTTPYAMRVYQDDGSTNTLTYNLDVNGNLKLGDGIDPISTTTTLSVYKDIGAYGGGTSFLKLQTETSSPAGASVIWWNNNSETAANNELQFKFGQNALNTTKKFSISPLGTVAIGDMNTSDAFSLSVEDGLIMPNGYCGLGTVTPATSLHIVNQDADANSGATGKVQGILVENVGWRDKDYALEIRTGHNKVFTVGNSGTVHIGSGLNWAIPNDGTFKLYVEKGIRAERVRVDVASENGWADYVFAEDYKLMSLEEIEVYVQEHNHLPNIPSASEVVEEGIDVAEMNKLLLEKVEELTLQLIEVNKRMKAIEANNSNLEQ